MSENVAPQQRMKTLRLEKLSSDYGKSMNVVGRMCRCRSRYKQSYVLIRRVRLSANRRGIH